jgi:hypothetical protein
MDVGADNFRFTLEEKNGLAAPVQTMRQPQTTELHLDSLDRYNPRDLVTTATFQNFPNSQNVAKGAGPILLRRDKSSTECVIYPGRTLAYGYFSRVALTQMYLNFEIPTVVGFVNDRLLIQWGLSPTGTPVGSAEIIIPEGRYTAATMATILQSQIRAADVLLGAATVTAPTATINGFQFAAGGSTYMCFIFSGSATVTEQTQSRYGRTARLCGIGRQAFGYTDLPAGADFQTAPPVMWTGAVGGPPNLIYTDYIDIVSQQLTNYKVAKDANSSIASPTGVIGRIWLTEGTLMVPPANNAQPNGPVNIGSGTFSLVKTWTHPNWCQWSPNQTLSSIDITLLDMFGTPIPWTPQASTEWSATLTFSE